MARRHLADAVNSYAERRPLYEAFAIRLEHLLRSLLEAHDVKYQVVESRAKTTDSFAQKMGRAGKNYGKPLEDITDLCGARVILYYADDIRTVSEIIKQEFTVVEEELSHQPDAFEADRFGYLSVHYVVQLNSDRAGLAEWKAQKGLRAEIQIRTVIQHAWSAVSHALQYKQETAIPSALRRRLFRIAGLFELADEEFVGIRDQRQRIVEATAGELARGNKAVPLSSASIRQMLAGWKHGAEFMTRAFAAGFDPDEDEEDLIPDIYNFASKVGISTVEELEAAASSPDFSIIERIASKRPDGVRWLAGEDYGLLIILMDKFPDKVTEEYLMDNGWHSDIAKTIAAAVRQKR